ncbi:hypothetical protein CN200_24180 [Sinorhizobium meliloti]|uniref:amidohydrolase family protein n=1 Tax=Rhizobium meliloti TaxID=382 RepID=UPI00030BF44A|nr:amidohydrolase family protein [Sinorhizobium meliloti]RVI12215.1 hypothetical protein CN200_24180 [Sinorhizobium meliloti]RVL76700.1 hypothetical protein CN140_27795 [Sinorhizobium meliloti]RVN80510.1 hypothetical protein CN107_28720 [Sinorhizobium meliloti]RVO00955.1 hypothetical protein CN103_28640 [Sinorhizobium meliloti]
MIDRESALQTLHLEGGRVTDCHVHIFGSSRDMAEPRFPHPEEPAEFADFEKLGGALGVQRYVLTQPSFLGFDNSLILKALAARPTDFRGVICLEQSQDPASIAKFAENGVAGLRFPLKYANSLPDWSAYGEIFQAAAQSNIHVELGLAGPELIKAVHKVLEHGAQVVVAHLGMFDPDLGPDRDPAFGALMEAAQTRRIWIKLSAPYRSTEAFADRACERILEVLGPDRTVWGSDWPHVGPRLNRQSTYPTTLSWLLRIASGEAIKRQIFEASPDQLYNFASRAMQPRIEDPKTEDYDD